MRLATPLLILVLAAVFLGGCGGSSDETGSGASTAPAGGSSTAPAGASARACPLNAGGIEGVRATGVSCGEAQRLAYAWQREKACRPAAGASRSGCSLRSYRCLATATDRGWSVSCAKPGRSVAFTVRRG
jgi:hypothetical protein